MIIDDRILDFAKLMLERRNYSNIRFVDTDENGIVGKKPRFICQNFNDSGTAMRIDRDRDRDRDQSNIESDFQSDGKETSVSNQAIQHVTNTSKVNQKIVMFFIPINKVSIQVIKNIMSFSTTQHRAKHIIICHVLSLTPDAKQIVELNSSHNTPYFFETFTFDFLSFDPIIISTVPSHTKVSIFPKELTKLRRILSTDVICKYYGFQIGDIILLNEESGVSYCRCVK